MITRTCTEDDDPFDFDETDPAKTKAVESGLWEIRYFNTYLTMIPTIYFNLPFCFYRTLQSHILPQVAHAG